MMMVMEPTTLPTTDFGIMAHVVGPTEPDLPLQAAREILQMRLDDVLIQRLHHLTQKNGQGTLNESERCELDSYLRVGQIMNLLQAKARVSLKRHNVAS
jgi:hypothetical protein